MSSIINVGTDPEATRDFTRSVYSNIDTLEHSLKISNDKDFYHISTTTTLLVCFPMPDIEAHSGPPVMIQPAICKYYRRLTIDSFKFTIMVTSADTDSSVASTAIVTATK
jgi:hypothetical protein